MLGHDRRVTGRVEDAVRKSVPPGELLATPAGRGQFTVARYISDGLALLLGKKEAWTQLSWKAMEGVPDFLRPGLGSCRQRVFDAQPARQPG